MDGIRILAGGVQALLGPVVKHSPNEPHALAALRTIVLELTLSVIGVGD